MFKRLATWLGAVAALALLAPASARAEEDGIKIGDGRLHPFFDLESRLDSAAQIQAAADGTAKGEPDLIWHFRPGLKLDVPSPVLSVSLTGALEYLLYTGLSAKVPAGLDRFQGEGGLDVGIFRGSVVSVNVGDHLTRSTATSNPSLAYGVLSLYNDAYLTVPITPGGGSLSVTPGYHISIENYSNLFNISTAGTFDPSSLNYLNQRITLENRWRFLPKTAVLLDGAPNTGINYFKVTTGVAGLVTPHFSTVARLGYGQDLSTGSVSGVAGIIGQLEASYLPTETASVRLGVVRDFQPVTSPYVDYTDDRPYLAGRVQLFGRLVLHGQASLDYLSYLGGTGPSRNDLVFSVDAGADFEAFRWLILSGGGVFADRSSDNKTTLGLNFNDEQGYIRLTFIY
jgi:hypothetical protein